MGGCFSRTCNCFKGRRSSDNVSSSKDIKTLAPNLPSTNLTECKDEAVVIPESSLPKESQPEPQDKRVVVHETVSNETPLKENHNVNLLPKPAKPGGKVFSGKPFDGIGGGGGVCEGQIPVKRRTREGSGGLCDGQIAVKRRAREGSPAKPRQAPAERAASVRRSAPSPRRGVERAAANGVGTPVKKIPVKRQNLGELRSRSPTHKSPRGGDALRRTNSSRRMKLKEEAGAAREISEVRGKDLACVEAETVVEDVAEKPINVCQVPTEAGGPSEAQSDEALPPIDLENPLISLDCFIFL